MVGAAKCKIIVATRSSLLSCFVSNFRFIDTDAVKRNSSVTDEGACTSLFKVLNSWHIIFTKNPLMWLKRQVYDDIKNTNVI